MSASLVGSEMCIRDSASPLLRRARDLRVFRPTWQGTPPKANAPPCWFDLCLLYTSDAADDM
eukprot:921178-Alexandrium_andersonii.AAC.1